MGFEIDFLPVGNGKKSGDAIGIRYGQPNDYTIMVIDGGTKESGKNLVEHIKKYYETTYVDYVVNTHPDMDHASGLTVVLDELEVGELIMHLPWEHSEEIRNAFNDGRITDSSLSDRLQDAYNAAYNLWKLAKEKGIPIREPFSGEEIGAFRVLSPTKEFYQENLIYSDKTPKENKFIKFIKESAKKAIEYIYTTWDKEMLREDVSTSPENENSVILYGLIDGKGILFTGDAGVRGLNLAADRAESLDINLEDCRFQQVPHHGSRRNVSSNTLNRIVGSCLQKGQSKNMSAYISASEKSNSHPKRSVVNAYIRRGASVFTTEGNVKWHHNNMPLREDYSQAIELEFSNRVESWGKNE
jgi:beta-lactamase superfamily II metal-dependent hydrolase